MTSGNDPGVRLQQSNENEWRSADAELQVNGMDVVNSESDHEMGESTDDEEDEPDFVDVEEDAEPFLEKLERLTTTLRAQQAEARGLDERILRALSAVGMEGTTDVR